jgi:tetratricopeptide (TPR) repeat protein
LLALIAASAPAQGIVVNGGSFTHGHGKSGKSLTFSLGSASGYGYGTSPYYSSFGGSRVTIISSTPQVVVVPIVILQRPSDQSADTPLDAPRRLPDRRDQLDDLRQVPPQAGQNAGPFRPRDADKPNAPPSPVIPELPPPGPAKPPEAERPVIPENATLLERGRAAFAAGEYGRAADIFRRAATADATDPQPLLFLIQSQIALGKYSVASETARSAVEHFPRWTELALRPIELYGAHADDYRSDLMRLDETLAAHPDDSVLLFLAGHALWFDGRKDEARALLRKAARTFPIAERFLRAAPLTFL